MTDITEVVVFSPNEGYWISTYQALEVCTIFHECTILHTGTASSCADYINRIQEHVYWEMPEY